ncbi:prolyl oligopeptidase family serine peptidase [Stetteria hydrogenophila]
MVGLKPIDPEDVVLLARPGPVDVSPGGDVAVVLARADLERNRYLSEVRVYTSGGEVYFIQADAAGSAQWSPEGRLLAFAGRVNVPEKEEGMGVYVAGRGGGPRLVAWFKHGVEAFSWLSSDRLAVASRKPLEGKWDPDGDYAVTDGLPALEDGAGVTAGLGYAVYTVDLDSGRPVEAASGEGRLAAFTTCRGRVYYAVAEDWRDPLSHTLKEVEPGGEARTVLKGYTIEALRCVGGELYALMHRRPIGLASHARLHRVDPASGGVECLTCGVDWNAWRISGELEGRPVLLYPRRGASVLAVVEGRDRLRDLTPGDAFVHAASARGGVVAYWLSTPTRPPELFVERPGEGGGREQLTTVNRWFTEKYAGSLREPVYFRVKAAGDEVDAWAIDPKPGEEKPVILFIHGGPKGLYGYYFHPEMRFFASRGFLVVYSNPRGSDGYSEEFADIRGRYGEVDYEQIMAALNEAVERFKGDRERMAVTGISYGGYMTNVIVTRTDAFRAAVPENGVADWVADYWASDIGYYFNPDQIGGTPLDNLEEYVKRSPAFHAGRVKTPLLIIHSLEDYRCFVDQALAMHAAVRLSGGESRLVIFKSGSHGFSVLGRPKARLKRLKLKLEWLEEKLGVKSGGKGEGGGS